jgi:hypothetical protein
MIPAGTRREMAMTVDIKAPAYAAAAAEAESAVMAVKDPELRRVAFEKILETLLERKIPGHGSARDSQRSSTPNQVLRNAGGQPTSRVQSGPKGYVEELIADSFFKEERTIAQVKSELANRGRHIALTSLSGPLQKLTQERRLRRQKIVSNGKSTKATYAYSDW